MHKDFQSSSLSIILEFSPLSFSWKEQIIYLFSSSGWFLIRQESKQPLLGHLQCISCQSGCLWILVHLICERHNWRHSAQCKQEGDPSPPFEGIRTAVLSVTIAHFAALFACTTATTSLAFHHIDIHAKPAQEVEPDDEVVFQCILGHNCCMKSM